MLLLHGNKAFNDIAAAMYDKEDEILNYFIHCSTNAAAESLNAKIKQFRAQLRGIIDRKFFLLGSLEFMRSHTLLQVIRFFSVILSVCVRAKVSVLLLWHVFRIGMP